MTPLAARDAVGRGRPSALSACAASSSAAGRRLLATLAPPPDQRSVLIFLPCTAAGGGGAEAAAAATLRAAVDAKVATVLVVSSAEAAFAPAFPLRDDRTIPCVSVTGIAAADVTPAWRMAIGVIPADEYALLRALACDVPLQCVIVAMKGMNTAEDVMQAARHAAAYGGRVAGLVMADPP